MIYIVRASGTDMVKIGYTQDRGSLQRRIASLQTGQPWRLELLRTVDGDPWVEGWFHQAFASYRFHGEWFHYCPEMLDLSPETNALGRWRPRTLSRAALEALIQRLVDLLDEHTDDPECEPEADLEDDTEAEPDSDGTAYFVRGERIPAGYDLSRFDEDIEVSQVEAEAWSD